MSFCGCDWSEYNEAGGPCWACCHNNCEPCCGEPCNVLDGLYCCLCWSFCSSCQLAKMWASQVDQPCAFVNHCLPILIILLLDSLVPVRIFFNMLIRYNSRLKAGVYDTPDPIDRFIGDCFLPCCCFTAPCALGQELRTIPKEDWDCCGQLFGEEGCVVMVDEFRFMRSPETKTMNDPYHFTKL